MRFIDILSFSVLFIGMIYLIFLPFLFGGLFIIVLGSKMDTFNYIFWFVWSVCGMFAMIYIIPNNIFNKFSKKK